MAVQTNDTFTTGGRGTPNAWSPASNNANWLQEAGTATLTYNAAGQQGKISGDTSLNVMSLGGNPFYYSNTVCTITKTSYLTSSAGVLARIVNASTYYEAFINNGTLYVAATVNGIQSILGNYSFAEVVNTAYRVRLICSGMAQNTLLADVWLSGSVEPGEQITVIDSSITSPGLNGVLGQCANASEKLFYQTFNVIDPVAYPTQLPLNPYGVNIVNNPGNDPTGAGQQMLRDAVNGGYTRMRWIVSWAGIEQSPGQYTGWASTDAAIQAANAVGIAVHVVVRNPPTWNIINPCNNGSYVLMNTTAAAKFAAVFLHHYNLGGNGFITSWEWGNEDYAKGYLNCPDGSYAAALMQAIYPVSKALCPSVIVGPPATYMEPNNITWWYNTFFSAGGGGYTDFINIHAYPCPYGPNDVYSNGYTHLQLLRQVQTAIVNNGHSLPIWMTENSWAVTNNSCTVSGAQQSLFYKEMLDICRLDPGLVAVHFWFDISAMTSGQASSETFRNAYLMFQQYVQSFAQWPYTNNIRRTVAALRSIGQARFVALTRQLAARRTQL